MNINEFLRLLKQARKEYGYWFELGEGLRIVPDDDTEFLFSPIPTRSIIHHDEAVDIRIFYPTEVVWHCFYREDHEPHIPGPGVASRVLGLNHRRSSLIMGAGSEWHGHDKELRRLMLKATGLKEIPMEDRKPISIAKPRTPPHGSRAPRRKAPRPPRRSNND